MHVKLCVRFYVCLQVPWKLHQKKISFFYNKFPTITNDERRKKFSRILLIIMISWTIRPHLKNEFIISYIEKKIGHPYFIRYKALSLLMKCTAKINYSNSVKYFDFFFPPFEQETYQTCQNTFVSHERPKKLPILNDM